MGGAGRGGEAKPLSSPPDLGVGRKLSDSHLGPGPTRKGSRGTFENHLVPLTIPCDPSNRGREEKKKKKKKKKKHTHTHTHQSAVSRCYSSPPPIFHTKLV